MTQKVNSRKATDLKGLSNKKQVINADLNFVDSLIAQEMPQEIESKEEKAESASCTSDHGEKPAKVDARNDQTPPEVLYPFKDLAVSKLAKCLRETYGKKTISLTLIGHFLNFVGNYLLQHIYLVYSNMERKCQVFYPMHKAVSIQLMQNGDVLTKVEKREFFL